MATILNEFLDRKTCRNFGHLPQYRDLSGKFRAAHPANVASLKQHRPREGFCRRAMLRNNVLLPEPLAPHIAVIRPDLTETLTDFSAGEAS